MDKDRIGISKSELITMLEVPFLDTHMRVIFTVDLFSWIYTYSVGMWIILTNS